MSKVDISDAQASDFSDFGCNLPFVRVRAFTGRVDGKIIGIGGITFSPDGTRIAFCELSDEAHNHKFALHRIGLRTIALARELKINELLAVADDHAASERWLERLGFKPFLVNGIKVYKWLI